MSNSEKNICSIIIGEDVKFENIAKELDIDFQIQNDQIIGKINIIKSNKKFLINLLNTSEKKFSLELEIIINENSFLELRDESDYKYGSDIIIKQLNDGVQKVRVGIKPEGRRIARENTKIFNQSNLHIGEITSGTFGPSVNGPVAMGYVENEFSKKDTKVFLEVRGKKHPANICGLPFYKKSYVKGAN